MKLKIIISSALALLSYASHAQEKTPDEIAQLLQIQICNCTDARINSYMSRQQIDTAVAECYVKAAENALKENFIPEKYIEKPELLDPIEVKVARWLGDSCQTIVSQLQRSTNITATDQYFIPKKELDKDFSLSHPKGKAGFRMWTNKKLAPNTPTPEIQIVMDIRWVFDSPQKAIEFHKTNLLENSEGGTPNTDKIKIKGAQELHIYNENAKGAQMLAALGLDQHHHYFIFVVDKTVAKVFVATTKKCSTKKAAKYAKSAAKQLQSINN